MEFDRFTDEELVAMAAAARQKAHDAPKCISGTDAAPYTSGDAWARRSDEWMKIEAELDRRSVKQHRDERQ